MKKRILTILVLLAVIAPAAGTLAQQPVPETRGASKSEPGAVEDKLSTTSHAARIGGVDVRYTATAGTLVLRHANGKPRANVFFVAYVRDGQTDLRARPVTFAYNGGPGSASIWLHMGALGPKRVQMAAEGFQPAPPFSLVDNDESLLDVTDLVSIDAMSTGFSRAVEGEDAKQFHGVKQDVEAFSEFIRLYVTKFNRWSSPKYLFGESYGTVRSAGVAAELQSRHGVELNGIVLVSSVIDFITLGGNDMSFVSFLPTFTATAWYHKRLPAELQGDLKKTLDHARAFSYSEYLVALAKGNRLTPEETKGMASKIARFTGLSPEFIEQANLRVSPGRFRKELMRDRRLTVGRLDGRFTGIDADAAGETQEFDPSNTALQGAYTALFNDYVRRELKWETDLQYYTSGNVRPWDYGDYQNRYLNLTDSLRSAMARNPYLRVFVANGYYDMATPFAATEWTFDHLGYEKTYRERVRMGYYEAGHMMYIHPEMHKQLKRDVVQFIRSSVGATKEVTQQP